MAIKRSADVVATVAEAREHERQAETAEDPRQAGKAQAEAFARKEAARQWIFRVGPGRAPAHPREDDRSIREGVRPATVLTRDARFRRALAVADVVAAAAAVLAV